MDVFTGARVAVLLFGVADARQVDHQGRARHVLHGLGHVAGLGDGRQSPVDGRAVLLEVRQRRVEAPLCRRALDARRELKVRR